MNLTHQSLNGANGIPHTDYGSPNIFPLENNTFRVYSLLLLVPDTFKKRVFSNDIAVPSGGQVPGQVPLYYSLVCSEL